MRATSPTQRRGRQVEQMALAYLLDQGLNLVRRSYHCRLGEVDLIMYDPAGWRRPQLVFVEVRYRRDPAYGGAAGSITRAKQLRIVRAAQQYLMRYRIDSDTSIRFDVVAITGPLSTNRMFSGCVALLTHERPSCIDGSTLAQPNYRFVLRPLLLCTPSFAFL